MWKVLKHKFAVEGVAWKHGITPSKTNIPFIYLPPPSPRAINSPSFFQFFHFLPSIFFAFLLASFTFTSMYIYTSLPLSLSFTATLISISLHTNNIQPSPKQILLHFFIRLVHTFFLFFGISNNYTSEFESGREILESSHVFTFDVCREVKVCSLYILVLLITHSEYSDSFTHVWTRFHISMHVYQ